MLAQNIVLINLLWHYDSATALSHKLLVTTMFGLLMGYLYTDSGVPDIVWKVLINIQLLFLTYSRLPQIIHNYKNKSTGHLSMGTFALNCLGNFVRLLTVLVEVRDVYYIMTSVFSFGLNFLICIQIYLYKKKKTGPKHLHNEQGNQGSPEEEEVPVKKGKGLKQARRRNKTCLVN